MLQEVPPGVQLMGLSVEPAVPEHLRFIFHGLIWPDENALREKTRILHTLELRDDTVAWTRAVLKPEWIAADLQGRFRAANSIVSGQDAFLTRYAIDGNQIQIVVTRSFLHLVIFPASDYLEWNVPRAIREFLRVDQPGSQTPWTGEPWSTASIEGFTFGYHPSSSVAGWRDSLTYLCNRRAVKFSVRKIATREPDFREAPKSGSAPTEESEKHWFVQPR